MEDFFGLSMQGTDNGLTLSTTGAVAIIGLTRSRSSAWPLVMSAFRKLQSRTQRPVWGAKLT